MQIKTKYNFGDEVYLAYNSKIYKLIVEKITVSVKKESMGYVSHKEKYCFSINCKDVEIDRDNVYKNIKELEKNIIKEEEKNNKIHIEKI